MEGNLALMVSLVFRLVESWWVIFHDPYERRGSVSTACQNQIGGLGWVQIGVPYSKLLGLLGLKAVTPIA